MPITQTISALPTPPDPATDDNTTYPSKASAFTVAIAAMVAQLNAYAGQANTLESGVNTASGIASTAATNASTSEANALASKVAAQAAAASATNAANVAGTSTTSNTVPASITGSKSFTYVEANRVPSVGQYLLCADTAAPTANNIVIQVTAFNSGTNVVTGDVVDFKGAGAHTAWTISLCGRPGTTGAAGAAGALALGRKNITGNDTLVAADLGKIVRCTSAVAADFTVALDPAATLGVNWFVSFSNDSGYVATLTAASIDGATSKTVPPGNTIFIECSGADMVTQPLRVTPTLGALGTPVVVSSVGTAGYMGGCALSSGRAIAMFKGTSSFPTAALLSAAGAVIGTVQIDATAISGQSLQVVPLTATTALAVWCNAGGIRAAVLTDTGAAITAGAVATVEAVSSFAACAAVLTATKVAVFYGVATNTRGNVLTIAGNVITVATPATMVAGVNPNALRTAAISATQCVVTSFVGDSNVYAFVATEAATVLTPNTRLLVNQVTGSSNLSDLCALSASRVLVVSGAANSSTAYAYTLDVSGTGATAKLFIGRATPINGCGGQFQHKLVKLSAGTVLHAATDPVQAQNLTLGVFAVNGPSVNFVSSVNIARMGNGHELCLVSPTSALVLYADSNNGDFATAVPISLGNVI